MTQVGHLNTLVEKYYDKGFRVISISKEPVGLLESKMIKGAGAKYWMASDPGGSTLARYSSKGGGIPHAYLVDATGKVVLDTHPGNLADSSIEALLDQVFDPALDRELQPALRGAVKHYEKDAPGKAWAAAAHHLESENRGLAADAAYLREKAEAWAKFRRKLVEDGIASKDYETVFADLKEIPKLFSGMEVATWAAETRKKLEADPAVKTERKACKALRKAEAREEKAQGKAKKLGPARSAYRAVVKRYPGTQAAKLAEEALRRLGN